MTEGHAKERIISRHSWGGVHPVWTALAVAILGLLAMLVVDHGPWRRPHVQTVEIANHRTTGEAARSAGATVQQTPPKSALEPQPPGPQPAQPAIPDSR